MKKIILIAMALFMLVTFGCSTEIDSESKAPVGEKISIKLATVINDSHPSFAALEMFKKNVEEKSRGRIEVQLYGGGQLGTQQDSLDQMRLGDIQMTTVNPVVMSSSIGALAVYEGFYLFDSYEHAYSVFDGEGGQFLMDAFNVMDAQGIGFLPLGFNHFNNNKHPINTLADMKGVKIRGYSPIQIAAFEALGCTTSAISWNELYTSLQQKLINGSSLAPSNMIYDKFSEVTPYYSLTAHEFGVDMLLAGTRFLDSLSEEDRQLILSEAKSASVWLRGESEKVSEELMHEMNETYGVKINDVPVEVKQQMADIMQQATVEMIVKLAGRENYDKFMQYIEDARP